jgi:hypothetical protein
MNHYPQTNDFVALDKLADRISAEHKELKIIN